MGEKDPFIVELKLDYQKTANVSYFTKVDDAMTFVDEHMSERMIIIMDCRFGSVWQGVDAVMKLREKTSLVYVIMISANNVNQLSSNDIMSLINTENIFFIKNTDIAGAKEKIDTFLSICETENPSVTFMGGEPFIAFQLINRHQSHGKQGQHDGKQSPIRKLNILKKHPKPDTQRKGYQYSDKRVFAPLGHKSIGTTHPFRASSMMTEAALSEAL